MNFVITQQGGKQDRQRRVFGAGNSDLTLQGAATLNLEFVHRIRSLRRA